MANLTHQQPRQRLPRERDKDYLAFIASLSCVLCGAEPECAHIRFAEKCPNPLCEGGLIETVSFTEDNKWRKTTYADCRECNGTGYRYGKRPAGAGEKPSDRWTLPLCPVHHRLGQNAQHNSGEREWWLAQGYDPLAICKALQDAYEGKSRAAAIEAGMRVLEDLR